MRWDPYTEEDSDSIERVQRLAVRFTYGKFKRLDSPILLMQVNNTSKLETRRKMARLKLLHWIYTNSIRINLSEYLRSLGSRTTRSSHPFLLCSLALI